MMLAFIIGLWNCSFFFLFCCVDCIYYIYRLYISGDSYWLLFFGLILLQNGTTEEVKKIVGTLNEAQVPGEDVVGES